jgi:hypothetical protein
MKQHNLKSFNGFEKTNRSVGHFFFFSSTNVETKHVRPIAYNGIGLGAVVCRLVRWGNCAKPVLPAGAVYLAGF